jgi:hypothetical protein
VVIGNERKTWCNVFVADVCAAMGCDGPSHWYDPDTGAGRAVGKGREMTANLMVEWLRAQQFGWRTVSRVEAERQAIHGFPTVMAWPNPRGPAHVAMVLGVDSIAQAGGTNFFGQSMAHGFGDKVAAASFHTHD